MFVAFFFVLIVWCLAAIVMNEGWLIIECHIQSDGSALEKRTILFFEPYWGWILYRCVYFMWELATLLLYSLSATCIVRLKKIVRYTTVFSPFYIAS